MTRYCYQWHKHFLARIQRSGYLSDGWQKMTNLRSRRSNSDWTTEQGVAQIFGRSCFQLQNRSQHLVSEQQQKRRLPWLKAIHHHDGIGNVRMAQLQLSVYKVFFLKTEKRSSEPTEPGLSLPRRSIQSQNYPGIWWSEHCQKPGALRKPCLTASPLELAVNLRHLLPLLNCHLNHNICCSFSVSPHQKHICSLDSC